MKVPDLPYLSATERDAVMRACVRGSVRPSHYVAGGLLACGGALVGLFGSLFVGGLLKARPLLLTTAGVAGGVCGLAVPLLVFANLSVRRLCHRYDEELRRRGRCAGCGYDMRATPDRCAECGRTAASKADAA